MQPVVQTVLRGFSSEKLTEHHDGIQRWRQSSSAHISQRLAKNAQGEDNQHSKGSQHFSLGTADQHFLLFGTTSQATVVPPFLGRKPGLYCKGFLLLQCSAACLSLMRLLIT